VSKGESTTRRIRYNKDGIQIAADVNISVSRGEGGKTSQHVSSRQRVVQRNGKTVVSEQETNSTRSDGKRDP